MLASRVFQFPCNRGVSVPEAKRSRPIRSCLSDRLTTKSQGRGTKFIWRLSQDVYGYDPLKAYLLNAALIEGDIDGSGIHNAAIKLENDPDFAEICSVLSIYAVHKLIARRYPELLLNEGLDHVEGFDWLPKHPEEIPEFQSADSIVNRIFRVRSICRALKEASIAPRKLAEIAKSIQVYSGGLIEDILAFSNSEVVWIVQNEGQFFNGMARLRSTLPTDVQLAAYLIEFWKVVQLEDEDSIDRVLDWIALLDPMKSRLPKCWPHYKDVMALDCAFGLAEQHDNLTRAEFNAAYHALVASVPVATITSLKDPEILHQMVRRVVKSVGQTSMWLGVRAGFESPVHVLLEDSDLDKANTGIEIVTSSLSRLASHIGGDIPHILRDRPEWVLQSDGFAESLSWSSEMLLTLCQSAGIGKLSGASTTKELVGALEKTMELKRLLVDGARADDAMIQENLSMLGYQLNHLAAPAKPGVQVLRFIRQTQPEILAEYILCPSLVESKGALLIEIFDHDLHYTLDQLVQWPELMTNDATLSMALSIGRAAGGKVTCKRCDVIALRLWFIAVRILGEQGVPFSGVVKMLGELWMSTGCNLLRSRGFAVFNDTYNDKLVALLWLWWQHPDCYDMCRGALTAVAKSGSGTDIHVEQLFTMLLYHYSGSMDLDLSNDMIGSLEFAGHSSQEVQEKFPLICYMELLRLQSMRPPGFGNQFDFEECSSLKYLQ